MQQLLRLLLLLLLLPSQVDWLCWLPPASRRASLLPLPPPFPAVGRSSAAPPSWLVLRPALLALGWVSLRLLPLSQVY